MEFRVFRNSYRDDVDEHRGYEFFATREAAKRAAGGANQNGLSAETQSFIYDGRNVGGVLSFLNRYATHPDNG